MLYSQARLDTGMQLHTHDSHCHRNIHKGGIQGGTVNKVRHKSTIEREQTLKQHKFRLVCTTYKRVALLVEVVLQASPSDSQHQMYCITSMRSDAIHLML